MTGRREEFKARMERQLAELHKRMVELEKLQPHSAEHAPSYDTVDGAALSKHLETMRRLQELDEHGEDSWHEASDEVKAMVAELRRAVEAKAAAKK